MTTLARLTLAQLDLTLVHLTLTLERLAMTLALLVLALMRLALVAWEAVRRSGISLPGTQGVAQSSAEWRRAAQRSSEASCCRPLMREGWGVRPR